MLEQIKSDFKLGKTNHFRAVDGLTDGQVKWLIEQAEKVERYEDALKEIMKVNEKYEWDLYGLAYAIAERALLD